MISLENIGVKTTYEIRQEIVRKGLKLPEKPCYRNLLICLIKALKEEEAEKEKKDLQEILEKQNVDIENRLQAKESRKLAYYNHKRSLESSETTLRD